MDELMDHGNTPLMAFGADRRETINAAIHYLENDPDAARDAVLAIYGKDFDPVEIKNQLRSLHPEDATGRRFSGWKMAQKVLDAKERHEQPPQIKNLTPHELVIVSDSGEELARIPSSGMARVEESDPVPQGSIAGIPISSFQFTGTLTGVPDPQEGVVYVVPFLTAQALLLAGATRDDIYVPGPQIRDEKGRVTTSCVGLRRLHN